MKALFMSVRGAAILLALAGIAGGWLGMQADSSIAGCRVTVDKDIVTCDPSGDCDTCEDGKTKKVCDGKGCGYAAKDQSGKTSCSEGTATITCQTYVGVDPLLWWCYWSSTGTANGTASTANLTGDDCVGK